MNSETNVKAIARALNSLFQLSDEDRETVFRLWNMSESEREIFVQALSPELHTKKKPAKKPASKKSPRASGMAQAIKESLDRGRAAIKPDDDDSDSRCSQCDMTADMPIHDPNGGYISHHPFSPAAPAASDSSSANGGAGGGTASSKTETEDASNAVHAGG